MGNKDCGEGESYDENCADKYGTLWEHRKYYVTYF